MSEKKINHLYSGLLTFFRWYTNSKARNQKIIIEKESTIKKINDLDKKKKKKNNCERCQMMQYAYSTGNF